MTSDDLYRIARRAVAGAGWVEPADTAADQNDDSWNAEAPIEATPEDEPGLRFLAWVAARHPNAEIRTHFVHGVEILYFCPDRDRWGAVTLLDDKVARLPLEPNDARRMTRDLGLQGADADRLIDELTWQLAR